MELLRKPFEIFESLAGFKTNRQIIVIESDDWGSIRTKNQKVRENLNNISSEIRKDLYSQIDNIADVNDLNALFEVLSSVSDKHGNPASITANVCMANPDFQGIKESEFTKFFYEPFIKSIDNIHGDRTWALWQEGIAKQYLKPQLHGREHVHALQWLAELKAGNRELQKAFELESFGIPYRPLLAGRRKNLQAALDIYGHNDEKEFQENWIRESADLFSEVFGYRSTTFIPPAYTWHSRIDNVLRDLGIIGIQGIKLQYQPKKTGYRKRIHYTGQRRKGLTYIVRNAFFEPATSPEKDWIGITFAGIKKAFERKQPAIVGSHRINFIGNIEENNRTENLKMLKNILVNVVKTYPQVEFKSSNELLKVLAES